MGKGKRRQRSGLSRWRCAECLPNIPGSCPLSNSSVFPMHRHACKIFSGEKQIASRSWVYTKHLCTVPGILRSTLSVISVTNYAGNTSLCLHLVSKVKHTAPWRICLREGLQVPCNQNTNRKGKPCRKDSHHEAVYLAYYEYRTTYSLAAYRKDSIA